MFVTRELNCCNMVTKCNCHLYLQTVVWGNEICYPQLNSLPKRLVFFIFYQQAKNNTNHAFDAYIIINLRTIESNKS